MSRKEFRPFFRLLMHEFQTFDAETAGWLHYPLSYELIFLGNVCWVKPSSMLMIHWIRNLHNLLFDFFYLELIMLCTCFEDLEVSRNELL